MTALNSAAARASAASLSGVEPVGSSASHPWVLVAGGFHRRGGMDKANLALAEYLVEQGTRVHIVAYHVDPDLARHPLAAIHLVSRPANSYLLGQPLLDRAGRKVARQLLSKDPQARVLVNGANCLFPGINWVHCVHQAWHSGPSEGPLLFRARQWLNCKLTLGKERRAARLGRLFIANSQRTRRDLIERLGIDARLVRTIYLGAESDWGPASASEKAAARKMFEIPEGRRAAVFIGAMGHDGNKGFGVLLEAWRKLCADPSWDADLLMAGSGSALADCRARVSEWKLNDRIRLLGFCDRVRDLLAAADVLVSPVRYEAYGLNVQEAICRGVPAIVSATAGIAERYGDELAPLLLPDPDDADDLAARLKQWRSSMPEWERRVQGLGEMLRRYGWQDMARQMVSLVDEQSEPNSGVET